MHMSCCKVFHASGRPSVGPETTLPRVAKNSLLPYSSTWIILRKIDSVATEVMKNSFQDNCMSYCGMNGININFLEDVTSASHIKILYFCNCITFTKMPLCTWKGCWNVIAFLSWPYNSLIIYDYGKIIMSTWKIEVIVQGIESWIQLFIEKILYRDGVALFARGRFLEVTFGIFFYSGHKSPTVTTNSLKKIPCGLPWQAFFPSFSWWPRPFFP